MITENVSKKLYQLSKTEKIIFLDHSVQSEENKPISGHINTKKLKNKKNKKQKKEKKRRKTSKQRD